MQVHFTTVLNTCPQTSEFLHKETTMQKPIWKSLWKLKLKTQNNIQRERNTKWAVNQKGE